MAAVANAGSFICRPLNVTEPGWQGSGVQVETPWGRTADMDGGALDWHGWLVSWSDVTWLVRNRAKCKRRGGDRWEG